MTKSAMAIYVGIKTQNSQNFCRECLQSHLQVYPPTPKKTFAQVCNPRETFLSPHNTFHENVCLKCIFNLNKHFLMNKYLEKWIEICFRFEQECRKYILFLETRTWILLGLC
jgi:hypothetical protein